MSLFYTKCNLCVFLVCLPPQIIVNIIILGDFIMVYILIGILFAISDYQKELILAIKNNDNQKVDEVFSRSKPIDYNFQDPSNIIVTKSQGNVTLLGFAAYKGNLEIVDKILHFSNIAADDHRSSSGPTPLQLACIGVGKEQEKVVIFLAQRSSIDVETSPSKLTAINYAAKDGQFNIMRLLVANKANVNHPSNFGTTPLMSVIHTTDVDLFELLLANGANINATDSSGFSVLMHALKAKSLVAVNWLLSHQVEVNTKSAGGLSPLSLAIQNGLVDIVEKLDQNGAIWEASFFQLALKNHHWKIAKYALSKDPQVLFIQDEFGNTILHQIALSGNLEQVKRLVEWGANINTMNKNAENAQAFATNKEIKSYLASIDFLKNLPALCAFEEFESAMEFTKIAYDELLKTGFIPDAEFTTYVFKQKKLRALIELVPKCQIKRSNEHFKNKGVCALCFSENTFISCPAANSDCLGQVCHECACEIMPVLIATNRESKNCLTCNSEVDLGFFEQLDCKESDLDKLKEIIILSKSVQLIPNWNVCPNKDCPYGAVFPKGAPKHYECLVCDFKGCLDCHTYHPRECYREDGSCFAKMENERTQAHLEMLIKQGKRKKLDADVKKQLKELILNCNNYKDGQYCPVIYCFEVLGANHQIYHHRYDGKNKACPKCGILIKKKDGCNHMKCQNKDCKFDFNWE